MDGINLFYQTGFWTVSGILVTGIGMVFVFYRWVSAFAEKINDKITELELEHTKRTFELEQNLVSKEQCVATGIDRAKPLLIEIAHLKEGQERLIKRFDKLQDTVEKIHRNTNGGTKEGRKVS